jgi:hypothetical protein
MLIVLPKGAKVPDANFGFDERSAQQSGGAALV